MWLFTPRITYNWFGNVLFLVLSQSSSTSNAQKDAENEQLIRDFLENAANAIKEKMKQREERRKSKEGEAEQQGGEKEGEGGGEAGNGGQEKGG